MPSAYHAASKMEALAPCKLLLSWAHSTRAVRNSGTDRVDISASHHARRSAQGPAAQPVKGRRYVLNGGTVLDPALGLQ
ncbi:MAG: hypothetical protein ABJH93_12775 [Roseibium sp.]|uniref:hypothetical protein n=1 Tax=Roseibium sp. TaxID=1936156 RepID=UPI00329A5C82